MSTTAPNYEGLLKLLYRLKRFPDAIGVTTLMPAEAMEIRALGFRADPGRWKVPALPPDLTRDTSFEGWSTGWFTLRSEPQPISASVENQARQARIPSCDTSHPDIVTPSRETKEQRLMRSMRGAVKRRGRIKLRRLQQLMGRHSACLFRRVLEQLIVNRTMRLEDGCVVLAQSVTHATERASEPCASSAG